LNRRDLLVAALPIGWLPAAAAVSAVPLRSDRAGRLLLDTSIDGRGPFRFLLDTGAEVSAISTFLARELRLPATADAAARDVLGSTGGTRLGSVRVRELGVDRMRVANRPLVLLPEAGRGYAELDGVLGVDLLGAARARLQLSWRDSEVTIEGGSRGRHEDLERGLRRIDVAGRRGSLLAVRGEFPAPSPARPAASDARGRMRVEVAALLDTGAQRSIGNAALRRALRLEQAEPAEAVVQGVGGQAVYALQIDTPPLTLGVATLPAMALLYADLPVFATWGWQDRPALLLGMDLLGRLSALSIDYRRMRVALAGDAS
jgi:hypothetical protein